MKIYIISSLLILSVFSAKSLEKSVTGVNSNYPGVQHIDSTAYGYASNNGHTLINSAGFISPKMMERIPLGLNNPYTGIIGEADEIQSNKFYYDGTENLGSSTHVNCDILSTIPDQCVHNSGCGWCGSNSRCIPGNSRGPLGNCLRSTFLYTKPSKDWNPLKAGTININAIDKDDQPLLRLTHTPDLSKVFVRRNN